MDSGKKTNHSESKNGDGEYKEDKYFSNHNDSQLLKKYIHDIRNSNTFSIDILKKLKYDKIMTDYHSLLRFGSL